MTLVLLTLSVALLALALWLALRARRGLRQSGLPQGRLVYADTGRWSAVARPYFSPRYRLTGKPDYLVASDAGLTPVEVKHTAAPAGGRAYDSHIMQLAAYCLLVEETEGRPPPHGLLCYHQRTFRIPYDDGLREHLLGVMAEMRRGLHAAPLPRNHNDPVRCRFCGYRAICDQSLISRGA